VALVALSVPAGAAARSAAGQDVETPEPVGFELASSRVLPKKPLFDGRRPVKLRFRFRARRLVDLRVSVVARNGRTVAAW
jgi:hypothetical protein